MLLNKILELKSDLINKDLQIESYKVNYDILKEEKEALETNKQDKYNSLEIPKPLNEIETKLKACDKFTLVTIVEYLKLDSFELVKNLAKTTNKDNVSEVIAFRDGALSRDEALMDRLQKLADKQWLFTDRLTWEIKTKKWL